MKSKYTTGETQIIPHAVLMAARYKHVITYYIEFCEKNLVNQLSESTLHQTSKDLKPSQKKSLARLDDITAEGLNGLAFRKTLWQYMGRNKSVLAKLKQGKDYMKNGYQEHCNEHSSCSSHCITSALLHPENLKACVRYFLSNIYFSPNDSPSKTMKNVFYFI